jgi:hypothetical protein
MLLIKKAKGVYGTFLDPLQETCKWWGIDTSHCNGAYLTSKIIGFGDKVKQNAELF